MPRRPRGRETGFPNALLRGASRSREAEPRGRLAGRVVELPPGAACTADRVGATAVGRGRWQLPGRPASHPAVGEGVGSAGRRSPRVAMASAGAGTRPGERARPRTRRRRGCERGGLPPPAEGGRTDGGLGPPATFAWVRRRSGTPPWHPRTAVPSRAPRGESRGRPPAPSPSSGERRPSRGRRSRFRRPAGFALPCGG